MCAVGDPAGRTRNRAGGGLATERGLFPALLPVPAGAVAVAALSLRGLGCGLGSGPVCGYCGLSGLRPCHYRAVGEGSWLGAISPLLPGVAHPGPCLRGSVCFCGTGSLCREPGRKAGGRWTRLCSQLKVSGPAAQGARAPPKPVPPSSECPLGVGPVSGKSSSWELGPHHPRSGAGLSAGFPQE